MQWIKQYDLLVYLEPTPGYLPTEDGTRACDINYQNAIRDDFRILVQEMKKTHKDNLQLIESESNHVFDEKKSAQLLQDIHHRLFGSEKIKSPLMESELDAMI